MTHPTASAWLTRFGALLARIEVTDAEGSSLGLDEGAARVVRRIAETGRAGKKALLAGNGGSAAIAQHLHADLCKGALVRSLVFYDAPLLTATTNDEGWERVFERPFDLWCEAGDLAIAISSSGASKNILRGALVAGAKGARVVTLTGFDAANPLRKMGEVNFWVPSHDYGEVEGAHALLTHYLAVGAAAAREG